MMEFGSAAGGLRESGSRKVLRGQSVKIPLHSDESGEYIFICA
jgi:hypothetical protein